MRKVAERGVRGEACMIGQCADCHEMRVVVSPTCAEAKHIGVWHDYYRCASCLFKFIERVENDWTDRLYNGEAHDGGG